MKSRLQFLFRWQKAQTDDTFSFSSVHIIQYYIAMRLGWCSWHGELIKMMFSLRGALRFFAFLWLFNLLFAMLVIAFTHSFPIFCNGSSYSLTHTHTQPDRFRCFCIWSFSHFYGFISSLKPFTNDWKHPSPSARKKEGKTLWWVLVEK